MEVGLELGKGWGEEEVDGMGIWDGEFGVVGCVKLDEV